MKYRRIIFRARRKDTGEWMEGNYFHNLRKGEDHSIVDFDTNDWHEVYRESLQLRNYEGCEPEWLEI
jgi:hypothetical protein